MSKKSEKIRENPRLDDLLFILLALAAAVLMVLWFDAWMTGSAAGYTFPSPDDPNFLAAVLTCIPDPNCAAALESYLNPPAVSHVEPPCESMRQLILFCDPNNWLAPVISGPQEIIEGDPNGPLVPFSVMMHPKDPNGREFLAVMSGVRRVDRVVRQPIRRFNYADFAREVAVYWRIETKPDPNETP